MPLEKIDNVLALSVYNWLLTFLRKNICKQERAPHMRFIPPQQSPNLTIVRNQQKSVANVKVLLYIIPACTFEVEGKSTHMIMWIVTATSHLCLPLWQLRSNAEVKSVVRMILDTAVESYPTSIQQRLFL